MAPQPPSTGSSPGDDARAAAAAGLVEVLMGKGTPSLSRPLPRWDDIVSGTARPGTGGRRKRIHVGFEIEATRELRERWGDPEEIPFQGSLLLIWQMEPDGDGIVAARLSSYDVQKGETAMGQIHNGLALAAIHKLKPAHAIVALRTSGAADYDRRIDFMFIRDRVAAEGLQWVCYREPDRIARDQHSAYSFYKFLENTNTALYLCSLGREVDWDSQSDKLVIGTLGVIGEFERLAIKARTHRAIEARWLETGRGYPGFKPIGFRRDLQGFLEQDLEQWPYILEAATMYSQLRPDGGTSIRQLADFLTEKLGFPISRDRVRTMLKQPIYVTGTAHVNYQATVYPIREIKLINPVPVETFELNQALMHAVKGRQRTNPLGHFLLNRIDFRHDTCEHHTADAGPPALLRGDGKSYKHDRHHPLRDCRRFALPHKEVDAAVAAELLRLCEDPELQRDYQQRALTETDKPPVGVLSPPQQRSYQARITDLTRQREEIVRGWLDESATGKPLNPRYLQESVEHVDAEIARLTRQLQLSDQLLAGQKPATTDRERLLERAREILTPEPPDDPELCQRRMIFVQQALSKVVARRTKTGFELQLFGPLIPADAAPLHFDPLQHARPCLQKGTDLQEFSSKSVPRWRAACGPVWQSEPIRVRCSFVSLRTVPASREQVAATIRIISAESGPGPIKELLALGVPGRGELVSFGRIMRCVAVHGLTLDGETRAALGVEKALRLRRVRPASVADWRLIVGWAIEEGLSFERGWSVRWDDLNSRVGWLRSHRHAVDAQGRLGFSLANVVAREQERRGLPVIRIDHRPGRGRDSTLEACMEGLRQAALLAAPGRLSWSKIDAALSARGDVPTAKQMNLALHYRGMAKETALRLALGRSEALVSGRVVARTRAEWVTVMSAAIDDGYAAGPGWAARWDAMRGRDARYVSAQTLLVATKAYGGVGAVYAAAAEERYRAEARTLDDGIAGLPQPVRSAGRAHDSRRPHLRRIGSAHSNLREDEVHLAERFGEVAQLSIETRDVSR